MVMELRKRKLATEAAPAPPPKKKTTSTSKKPTTTSSSAAAKKKDDGASEEGSSKLGAVVKADEPKETEPAAEEAEEKANGDKEEEEVINLDGLGGEVLTNDGKTTTLKALVEESKAGVVIFTYPKASTPGCTTQACLFRDAYQTLTTAGLSVFGLSTDSPKANTTFKQKKELPYTLLCDPSAALIGPLGLKKTSGKGTVRGVVVLDRKGTVVVRRTGGPAATLEAVEAVLDRFM